MGQKYCSEWKEVEVTKALSNYSQVEYRGNPIKRKKIGHLEEDGGYGCGWYTVELAEGFLTGSM